LKVNVRSGSSSTIRILLRNESFLIISASIVLILDFVHGKEKQIESNNSDDYRYFHYSADKKMCHSLIWDKSNNVCHLA